MTDNTERPLIEVAREHVYKASYVSARGNIEFAKGVCVGYEAGRADGIHDSRNNDETMRDQMRARIAALEAEVAMLRRDLEIAEGIAARGGVTGLVIDDAMVSRFNRASGHQNLTIHERLATALTSATTVPLVSAEPEQWMDGDGEAHEDRHRAKAYTKSGNPIPLYRGFPPQECA